MVTKQLDELYEIEGTIGQGHFAVVKQARHKFSGERVAIKVIDKAKLDKVSREHLYQEVICMKLVQHPNVVRLYEVIDTPSKLYLILEFGDGGDMFDHIMSHPNGLSERKSKDYFRQIVRAIKYCHDLHVVHRDLKPENVVFFEKTGQVKLTDFGFSNKFVPGTKLLTSCGSLAYSAPELLLGDSYDAPSVDVWSLGVILYMLVTGRAPFQEANESETLTMILDCKYYLPSNLSYDCNELISRLLVRDPEKRLKLDEIINHNWLKVMSEEESNYSSENSDQEQQHQQSIGGAADARFSRKKSSNKENNQFLANNLTVPLIKRENLSEKDNNDIIERMVNGNIASKEEINRALEKDEYNHITATYYLMAERIISNRLNHQFQKKNKRKLKQINRSSMSSTNAMTTTTTLVLGVNNSKNIKIHSNINTNQSNGGGGGIGEEFCNSIYTNLYSTKRNKQNANKLSNQSNKLGGFVTPTGTVVNANVNNMANSFGSNGVVTKRNILVKQDEEDEYELDEEAENDFISTNANTDQQSLNNNLDLQNQLKLINEEINLLTNNDEANKIQQQQQSALTNILEDEEDASMEPNTNFSQTNNLNNNNSNNNVDLITNANFALINPTTNTTTTTTSGNNLLSLSRRSSRGGENTITALTIPEEVETDWAMAVASSSSSSNLPHTINDFISSNNKSNSIFIKSLNDDEKFFETNDLMNEQENFRNTTTTMTMRPNEVDSLTNSMAFNYEKNNDESLRTRKFNSKMSLSGADTSSENNSDIELRTNNNNNNNNSTTLGGLNSKQDFLVIREHDWNRSASSSSRSRNKYRQGNFSYNEQQQQQQLHQHQQQQQQQPNQQQQHNYNNHQRVRPLSISSETAAGVNQTESNDLKSDISHVPRTKSLAEEPISNSIGYNMNGLVLSPNKQSLSVSTSNSHDHLNNSSLMINSSGVNNSNFNNKTLSIEHRLANMSQMSISSQLSKNNSIRYHNRSGVCDTPGQQQQQQQQQQQLQHSATPTPRESIVFNRGDEKPIAKILLSQHLQLNKIQHQTDNFNLPSNLIKSTNSSDMSQTNYSNNMNAAIGFIRNSSISRGDSKESKTNGGGGGGRSGRGGGGGSNSSESPSSTSSTSSSTSSLSNNNNNNNKSQHLNGVGSSSSPLNRQDESKDTKSSQLTSINGHNSKENQNENSSKQTVNSNNANANGNSKFKQIDINNLIQSKLDNFNNSKNSLKLKNESYNKAIGGNLENDLTTNKLQTSSSSSTNNTRIPLATNPPTFANTSNGNGNGIGSQTNQTFNSDSDRNINDENSKYQKHELSSNKSTNSLSNLLQTNHNINNNNKKPNDSVMSQLVNDDLTKLKLNGDLINRTNNLDNTPTPKLVKLSSNEKLVNNTPTTTTNSTSHLNNNNHQKSNSIANSTSKSCAKCCTIL